eukprot:c7996_g1_i1.p2 GENE.c7996_g1_i1~~c7996_g1_i1.p2  ORF type:complete len:101 (-),score=34.60 c7996_g1_i1:163-465(-)
MLDPTTEEHKKQLLEVERWNLIVMNDIESIPIAMLVAVLTLFCCHSNKAHFYLVIMYTVSRVFHTIAFARAKQPARSIAWFVGGVAKVGLLINGLIAAYQ